MKDTDGPLIETLFPNARLVSLAGAGHWVHFDAPDAFMTTLTGWL